MKSNNHHDLSGNTDTTCIFREIQPFHLESLRETNISTNHIRQISLYRVDEIVEVF